MNETTRTDLEQDVVDLGDAKEMTLGVPGTPNLEEHAGIPWNYE
ncbi:rubrivinodin family lasso peptide [Paucibacter sp. R3-3]|uniref:Rubrivinodin family lasso peptide n=1 Tax=Roseateles agri TaxID=3098619 RepID=A0ABU5DT92_9BURK|nr:rubrivinodin family lasso peptide [Paucibacter sp. R3-3]MDY0749101.1 rubrivinodin family lasso peptide [Paucibacter sp. R3-3]